MKRFFLIISILLLLAACGVEPEQNRPTGVAGECPICGDVQQYLAQADTMECVLCRQQGVAEACCASEHYICEECHAAGIDSVFQACMNETSSDPVAVFERLVSMPSCHMHGPEHHIIVGAALLTAYHNAGGEVDLQDALVEIVRRGKQVPGGACGRWGACGAALSAGMFVSIVTNNSPFATEAWHLSNRATAEALMSISEHGGPRCCKRDSYKALQSAVEFTKRELGVEMGQTQITCTRYAKNEQCLGTGCPYFPKGK